MGEDGTPLTQFNSTVDGLFRIVLPPGTYILRPQSTGAFPRADEQFVVVQDGRFSQVEIRYDSGIR